MFIFVWLCLLVGLPARATRFEIKDAGFRNLLYLVSDGPLEKILGQSNGVEGWLELNPSKIREGVKGQFIADLRAIETGSEARNEMVRDKILSVTENPIIIFEFAKIGKATSDTLKKDVPTLVRVGGQLKLRGISKSLVTHLRIHYFTENDFTRARLPGNLLKINASFDVNLADFGLSIPETLASRVAQVVQVSIDAIGSDWSASSVVLPPPDGVKLKENTTRINPNRSPASDH